MDEEISRKTVERQQVAVSVDTVAELLGISTRSVWRLVARGELPRPVRIGGLARWDQAAVLAWWSRQHEQAQNRCRGS